MPDVLSPVRVKRRYTYNHAKRPLLFSQRIEFRAHPDDVALLAAYATATAQKPGAVMRNLMRVLRKEYVQLQKTIQAGEP